MIAYGQTMLVGQTMILQYQTMVGSWSDYDISRSDYDSS